MNEIELKEVEGIFIITDSAGTPIYRIKIAPIKIIPQVQEYTKTIEVDFKAKKRLHPIERKLPVPK